MSVAIFVKFSPSQQESLSSTKSSSCSSLVSVFFPTPIDHTPQLLDIPNHMPSQSNLLSNYMPIIIPYCSSTLPVKKLSRYELPLF